MKRKLGSEYLPSSRAASRARIRASGEAVTGRLAMVVPAWRRARRVKADPFELAARGALGGALTANPYGPRVDGETPCTMSSANSVRACSGKKCDTEKG